MIASKFTARDKQILTMIANGASNKLIGKLPHVAEGTIKNRLFVLMPIVGAVNRAHLVATAFREGVIK